VAGIAWIQGMDSEHGFRAWIQGMDSGQGFLRRVSYPLGSPKRVGTYACLNASTETEHLSGHTWQVAGHEPNKEELRAQPVSVGEKRAVRIPAKTGSPPTSHPESNWMLGSGTA
jgi:hypothetical protein